MDELKPCPFCEGPAKPPDYDGWHWQVSCSLCWATGEPMSEGPQKAIDAWNPRPVEDALAARLAASQAEVARLRRFVLLVAQPDASLPPYLDDDEMYHAPVSVGDVRAARGLLMDDTPAAEGRDWYAGIQELRALGPYDGVDVEAFMREMRGDDEEDAT